MENNIFRDISFGKQYVTKSKEKVAYWSLDPEDNYIFIRESRFELIIYDETGHSINGNSLDDIDYCINK